MYRLIKCARICKVRRRVLIHTKEQRKARLNDLSLKVTFVLLSAFVGGSEGETKKMRNSLYVTFNDPIATSLGFCDNLWLPQVHATTSGLYTNTQLIPLSPVFGGPCWEI